MIRVNVGLSRKLSKDYNSTGFSVNLDGEITAPVSDPEGVIEQAKELFDLAEEALSLQVERYQSETSIAGHDEQAPPQQPAQRNGGSRNGSNGSNANGSNGNGRSQNPTPSNGNGNANSNGNGNGHQVEPATNKQIQFLLRLGEQQRMSKMQLEGRVAEILGRRTDIYQLSKRDAGVVLNQLTAGAGRQA